MTCTVYSAPKQRKVRSGIFIAARPILRRREAEFGRLRGFGPVIHIVGSISSQVFRPTKARQAADEVINKPIMAEQVIAVIEKLLDIGGDSSDDPTRQ